jgi:hypothetical protein
LIVGARWELCPRRNSRRATPTHIYLSTFRSCAEKEFIARVRTHTETHQTKGLVAGVHHGYRAQARTQLWKMLQASESNAGDAHSLRKI